METINQDLKEEINEQYEAMKTGALYRDLTEDLYAKYGFEKSFFILREAKKKHMKYKFFLSVKYFFLSILILTLKSINEYFLKKNTTLDFGLKVGFFIVSVFLLHSAYQYWQFKKFEKESS